MRIKNSYGRALVYSLKLLFNRHLVCKRRLLIVWFTIALCSNHVIDESVEWAHTTGVGVHDRVTLNRPQKIRQQLQASINSLEVNSQISKHNSVRMLSTKNVSADYGDVRQDIESRDLSRQKPDSSSGTTIKRKMAPAYVIVPELVSNSFKFLKRLQTTNQSNEKANELKDYYNAAQSSSLILRLLLDKYDDIMTQALEVSPIGDRKTRSTVAKSSDDLTKQNQRSRRNEDEDDYEDEDEENGVDQENEPETNTADQNDESDKSDNDDEPQTPPQQAVNFKSANNSLKLKRVDSKLERPPIYPPGDADKLYADALLVYVKDFNQYIE